MKKYDFYQYAQEILRGHLARISQDLPKVKSAKSPKPVHDCRVACRRLKNALWIFKKILAKKDFKIMIGHTRQIAFWLGPCRDVDVQLVFIRKAARAAEDQELKAPLRELSEALHGQRQQLLFDIAKKAGKLEQSGTILQIGQSFRRMKPKQRAGAAPDLRKLADKKTRDSLHELMEFESFVQCPEQVKELHQMRIALKKLRYTLENFSRVYDQRLNYFVRKLRVLQRELGDLHDCEVLSAELKNIGRTKRLTLAAGFIRQECRKQGKKSYRSFVNIWTKYKKNGFWRKLCDYIQE